VVIFLHVKHSSNVLSIAQRLLRIIVICTFSLRRCGLHNNMKILLFLFCLLQVSRNPDRCPEASALSRRRDTRPWPVGAQRTVSSQPLAKSFARVPDKSRTRGGSSSMVFALFLVHLSTPPLLVSRQSHSAYGWTREMSGHSYYRYCTIRWRLLAISSKSFPLVASRSSSSCGKP
jgi:hypothetical protein